MRTLFKLQNTKLGRRGDNKIIKLVLITKQTMHSQALRIMDHDNTPQKTRIHLKRCRQNKIPEVQIKLDDMLTIAYSKIRMDTRKPLLIANSNPYNVLPKQYCLDNSLLKQYISYIYGEYSLPDPALSDEFYTQSQALTRIHDSSTPKRTGNFHNDDFDTASRLIKNRSRTLDKISRMKQKFKQQMGDDLEKSFGLGYSNITHYTPKAVSEAGSSQERKFPLSKTVKKLKIKIVSRQKMKTEANRTSYLLCKSKYHYCLMCEAPLEDNFITKHEKKCPELQKFLSQKVLNKAQIVKLLDHKIRQLEAEVMSEVKMVREDAMKMEVKFRNIMERKDQDSQASIEGERDEVKEFVSGLGLMQCWEKMDKLEWFKLMRARAKTQIPLNISQ